MMQSRHNGDAVNGISLGDLEIVAEAIMLRLGDPADEELRVNAIRDLLWAGSELTRALAMHTQHALVDCCGSHGIADLGSDTKALHASLGRYAEMVASVAREYRELVPRVEFQGGAALRLEEHHKLGAA